MSAIREDRTPNLLLMGYALAAWEVRDLLLIPSFMFLIQLPRGAHAPRVPSTRPRVECFSPMFATRRREPHARARVLPVIKRPPLSSTARRAGWVGCNIALNRVPAEARISVVTESAVMPASEVREKFKRVKPLKDISVTQRGWTLDVLNIVRRLISEGRALRDPNFGKMGARITRPSDSFTTADVYAFERELEKLHPDNRHVRDNPVKDFVSRGKNSPTTPSIARFGFVAARRARRLADSVIIWPVRRMEPPSKLAEQSAV